MSAPRTPEQLPSVGLLRELFIYDPATGDLMWRKTGRGRRLDRKITCVDTAGYLYVSIACKGYRVHRVIWAIVHGQWPTGEIDHKNRDKIDNRDSNLRDCSHMSNTQNSKAKRSHKLKGAFFRKRSGLYQSMIFVAGTYIPLGYFKTEAGAHAAYAAASKTYFGEFARAA